MKKKMKKKENKKVILFGFAAVVFLSLCAAFLSVIDGGLFLPSFLLFFAMRIVAGFILFSISYLSLKLI
jgi:hypothetical protein